MSFMKPTTTGVNGPNSFNTTTTTGSNFMAPNPAFDPRPHIQVTAADTCRPSIPPYSGYGAPPTPTPFLPHHTPSMQNGLRGTSPYTTQSTAFDPYRVSGPHGYGRY